MKEEEMKEINKIVAGMDNLLNLVKYLADLLIECQRRIDDLSIALFEKGILTPKDLEAAHRKIEDYKTIGRIIDWDKLKTIH